MSSLRGCAKSDITGQSMISFGAIITKSQQNLVIDTLFNTFPNPAINPEDISASTDELLATPYTGVIKLCMKPHTPALSISQVSQVYRILQLASLICHMLELQDNRTSLCYWDYSEEQLPLSFHFIDVWNYFHISIPALSEYSDSEYISIHCKAEDGKNVARFSPVIIEVNPAATGIHCEFSPSLDHHFTKSSKFIIQLNFVLYSVLAKPCCIVIWRQPSMPWYSGTLKSPHAVGGILVPCTNRLYGPVLTLWMYHTPYASRIL